MRLKEAWQTRGWVKLAAAVIINAVFLALMLTCFAPVYETNDDLFLSKFVDGQLSHRTIWMPYVNIVLACLIKVLYGAFGTGFPWYSFCEYLVLHRDNMGAAAPLQACPRSCYDRRAPRRVRHGLLPQSQLLKARRDRHGKRDVPHALCHAQ